MPEIRWVEPGAVTAADVTRVTSTGMRHATGEGRTVLHALPAKIVEYRQYAKLKGTYVAALPAMKEWGKAAKAEVDAGLA